VGHNDRYECKRAGYVGPGPNPSDATVGKAYVGRITVLDGLPPLPYMDNGGAAAPGVVAPSLAFDAGTGEVTGTPTKAGQYNFVFNVTDSSHDPERLPAVI
jgi:hypothetical protein